MTYPYIYQTMATLFFGCMLLFGQFKKSRNRERNPNGLPLPPGPRGYPLIGNLFDFPIHYQWLVYEEWSKTYGKYLRHFIVNTIECLGILGDMMYFSVLGQPFLILGSLQRTSDLLEKRSSNYSDRMRLPMMVELYVLDFFHFDTFSFVPE